MRISVVVLSLLAAAAVASAQRVSVVQPLAAGSDSESVTRAHEALERKLTPSAKAKLQRLAATIATRSEEAGSDESAARDGIKAAFPDVAIGEGDVDALAAWVMMETAKDYDKDLKAMAAQMKEMASQKSDLRRMINNVKGAGAAAGQSAAPAEAPADDAGVKDSQSPAAASRVTVRTPASRLKVPAALPPNATAPAMQARVEELDALSETAQSRLQAAMDRRSKLMETVSNLLKKSSETADSVIANLK